MKITFSIIAMIVVQTLAAQNLVPNPGFEKFYNCPFTWISESSHFKLPGWYSASDGTPDYYNACSKTDCGVPLNWAGKASAHSGDGYVGIYVFGRNQKSYREYIECKLVQELEKDKEYVVEFYYKLSSYSRYKSDRIGLLVLDSALQLKRNKVFRVEPTLSVIHTPVEEGDWDLARMVYKASGGEDHIVIGNFFDDHNTENIRLDYRPEKSMLTAISYFYIDDVSVAPYDSAEEEMKKMQPLMAGTGNEIYSLNNIQFDFNSYELRDVTFPVLNRLITILQQKPQWKVELVGHTDDVGPESYNLGLSRNRADNVREYLQSRGILPGRITTSGAGESMLLASGTDEMSRTINRRVEVQFVEKEIDTLE